jgi:1,4-dihydroxy-2-naphthoyl-CoA synthase
MSYENVLTENRDGVLWLTVNRPEKLNALNRATLGEIADVFESVGDDDEIWAVVVTGSGEKAFVAGADISELNTLGPIEAKEFALRGQSIFRQIERLTKPVVAAVNGFALGGGCELAMACHLRVATSNAVFGQPEVKLGLIPGYAGTQIWCASRRTSRRPLTLFCGRFSPMGLSPSVTVSRRSITDSICRSMMRACSKRPFSGLALRARRCVRGPQPFLKSERPTSVKKTCRVSSPPILKSKGDA